MAEDGDEGEPRSLGGRSFMLEAVVGASATASAATGSDIVFGGVSW